MKFRLIALLLLVFSAASRRGQGQDAIDFATEIIPVLTRYGCNSGACHGAAAGRGGFHLSLLGGDADADYATIVRQFEGRRVNLAHADRSLLLAKPTGDLDHGGDVLFEPDSAAANLLKRWIVSGANHGGRRKLISIAITPNRSVAEMRSPTVQVQAIAHFQDQEQDQILIRDVTQWTVFTPTDPSAVTINEDHVATIHRRGMHVVLTRFLHHVQPLSLAVPFLDAESDSEETKTYNKIRQQSEPVTVDGDSLIDDEVNRLIRQLRLPVSPTVDDAMWFRRVSLDLTGRLPTPDEAKEFTDDHAIDKRATAIDRLLHTEGFIDYWTLRFARLLNLHALPNETAGTVAFADWIRQCIKKDVGFDEMSAQLLTASGDSHQVGPANFARMVPDARGHAELAGRVLLGIRIGCANCHNHPLDRWTQDDYHGFSAIFAPLNRGRHVLMSTRGEVTNSRTGQPAIPRIPGVRDLDPATHDHRGELAAWLVSDGKPAFAKAMVNRLWHSMFGRGLVDPPDDIRNTNPATHPELLDSLADDFIDHGYSIRHTLRRIATSEAYGRGAALAGNAIDDRFYSHRAARPLMPEVLADAIADVTGVANRFAGHEPTVRAVMIVDPLVPSPALDILGRCNRPATCTDSESQSPGLAADLHKINGDLINAKVTAPNGRLHKLVASGATDRQIIDRFYRLAFGREAAETDVRQWCERLESDDATARKQKMEDFVWAILSSRAFAYNH